MATATCFAKRVRSIDPDETHWFSSIFDEFISHPQLTTLHEIHSLQQVGTRMRRQVIAPGSKVGYRQAVLGRLCKIQKAQRSMGALGQFV